MALPKKKLRFWQSLRVFLLSGKKKPIKILRNALNDHSLGIEPRPRLMLELADAVLEREGYRIILSTLFSELDEAPINWKQVYKALRILEFLFETGSPRIRNDISVCYTRVKDLSEHFFHFNVSTEKDEGLKVRQKAAALLSILEAELRKRGRTVSINDLVSLGSSMNTSRVDGVTSAATTMNVQLNVTSTFELCSHGEKLTSSLGLGKIQFGLSEWEVFSSGETRQCVSILLK
eukprot:TRINITY_DN5152_c0_g1_i1.p1 TRINITY_DN5152_c0_g1~~TRINITY_DN5152_c0_g1_i1.p1  ORF type:complete len:234 (-),score=24.64 TRINITY_DN5152_c0_g1_i1:234-935(-)